MDMVYFLSFRIMISLSAVPKLIWMCHSAKRLFKYLNLFGCVILVSKFKNLPYRFSNLFICVISISKLVFKSHLGQNKTNLKTLY